MRGEVVSYEACMLGEGSALLHTHSLSVLTTLQTQGNDFHLKSKHFFCRVLRIELMALCMLSKHPAPATLRFRIKETEKWGDMKEGSPTVP